MRVFCKSPLITINPALQDEVRKLNIKISRMAYAELNARWKAVPFLNTTNNFYMILDGEADIWCSGHHIHMTPGNIYVVPSGYNFAYQCPQFCRKFYFLVRVFNGSGEELSVVPQEGLVLRNRSELISQMTKLYQNEDYYSALALRSLAEQLILEAMQHVETATIHKYSDIVTAALQAINEAPHLSLSAATLSDKITASAGHLRNQFSKEIGTPIAKYIRQRVLNAAEADLRKNNMTLSEIAAKYGFCDQFHFSRLFTEYFGISPSKYRKERII